MEEKTYKIYAPVLAYLVGLNILVMAGVAVLHELGHIILGLWYNCTNINLVLFNGFSNPVFTQMNCSTPPGAFLTALSSFIIIIPLAGLFYSLKGFKERYMGQIVLGIGILLSATDFNLLLISPGLEILILAIGASVALYGEYMLMRGIIDTELVSHHHQKRQEEK